MIGLYWFWNPLLDLNSLNMTVVGLDEHLCNLVMSLELSSLKIWFEERIDSLSVGLLFDKTKSIFLSYVRFEFPPFSSLLFTLYLFTFYAYNLKYIQITTSNLEQNWLFTSGVLKVKVSFLTTFGTAIRLTALHHESYKSQFDIWVGFDLWYRRIYCVLTLNSLCRHVSDKIVVPWVPSDIFEDVIFVNPQSLAKMRVNLIEIVFISMYLGNMYLVRFRKTLDFFSSHDKKDIISSSKQGVISHYRCLQLATETSFTRLFLATQSWF